MKDILKRAKVDPIFRKKMIRKLGGKSLIFKPSIGIVINKWIKDPNPDLRDIYNVKGHFSYINEKFPFHIHIEKTEGNYNRPFFRIKGGSNLRPLEIALLEIAFQDHMPDFFDEV